MRGGVDERAMLGAKQGGGVLQDRESRKCKILCCSAIVCVCVCRFHTRGYPNKPLECQVTCRRFLCVLLADFTELLGGQCTLGVRVCVHEFVCATELKHKSRKREGQNLLG